MKIEHEVVQIDKILVGECFEAEKGYYIKSGLKVEDGVRYYHCVNLQSGDVKTFRGSDTVYRGVAKFVVSSASS